VDGPARDEVIGQKRDRRDTDDLDGVVVPVRGAAERPDDRRVGGEHDGARRRRPNGEPLGAVGERVLVKSPAAAPRSAGAKAVSRFLPGTGVGNTGNARAPTPLTGVAGR
jgi:hypothetical protein